MAGMATGASVPNNDENNKNLVKCVAIGDAAVGKTCILISYTTNKFPSEYVPTVFDNYETQVDVNGEPYTFQLWDTAGSEHYDILRPLSYQATDVFLVVYSVVDRDSFTNVEPKWVGDIKSEGDPGVPFLIIGNKIDLRTPGGSKDGKAFVTKEEGEKLAVKLRATKFFEVSALTQTNLKEAFEEAMRLGITRKLDQLKKKGLIPGGDSKPARKPCCTIM